MNIYYIRNCELYYQTWNCESILRFRISHNFFENTFFAWAISEWSKLDKNIPNSDNTSTFKTKILTFLRPVWNSIFNYHNPKGVKLLTYLRPGLSHLREHKFKHSFWDTLNLFCCCNGEIEYSWHCLRYCSLYSNERTEFLDNVTRLVRNIFLIEVT